MPRRSANHVYGLTLGLLAVLTATPGTAVVSQTPVGLRNTGRDLPTGEKAIAANNPWLGAQVAYRFGGTDEFASNLLVAGQIVYPIDLGKSPVQLPVIGNVSTLAQTTGEGDRATDIEDQGKQLIGSAGGITLGLYPYAELHTSDYFLVTVHGLAAWRVNGLRPLGVDSTSTDLIYLHQGKFGAGVELLIGNRGDGSAPLSISVTPTITVFGKDAYARAFGVERGSVSTLEVNGILPVGSGVGVVFEGVLVDNLPDAFRVGLLLSTAVGDKSGAD